MDNAAQKLLESATHRMLHASTFSRSSSQASLVLTDLLSRYLALLSSTCAKHAQHAGRTKLTPMDALSALDELGVSLDELKEYGSTEGIELNRYAVKSLRRIEDLNEFRAQLNDGLRQDRNDAIPLHYAPFAGVEELEEDEDEEVEAQAMFDGEEDAEASFDEDNEFNLDILPNHEPRHAPPIPTLPLSPISNPSTPPRKRQRTIDWDPPPHIPDFLPPFPAILPASPPQTQSELAEEPLPTETKNTRPHSPALQAPPAQALTSSATADWLMQVPYSQSSLSSQPEWHLPSPPTDHATLPARISRFPTPQTDQSLFSAYHHILTSRSSSDSLGTSNPQRHKVAMSLLALTQTSSRWDPPDTLYSNLATNQPRVSAMGPSFAVPTPGGHGFDKVKDKDFKFPGIPGKSVSSTERLSNVVSQQSSRIPELARHVLPSKIFNRTSKLSNPPVMTVDSKQLIYGVGIPAPWNSSSATTTTTDPTTGKKEEKPCAVPDAKLFATWDSETKNYREPLGRGRQGGRSGKSILGSALTRKSRV
ncbi:uncharacterized protein BT62DRAFT_982303 [Guyanagaster necrorhizus]|uniref:Bromodomain associated domain-containing protein n=1 Tax=Guyanagaster necrorhizus TaxID=856835 RepID=A0A9P7VM06_9AGAR|nr:uncharacterized protein BT62DRAFT_982303 [Guyanagaster necrorhizus MCA 3950]KAG7442800.1 hypothetical protein BT62DRAFT_982303 [Guyanagaster necrorhizus MCA 3950]